MDHSIGINANLSLKSSQILLNHNIHLDIYSKSNHNLDYFTIYNCITRRHFLQDLFYNFMDIYLGILH